MVLEICLVVVLTFGIAALFWVMVRHSSEKIVQQYRKMAQALRVELTEPEPKLAGFVRSEPFLHGAYRKREMSISVPAKGLQNTRQIETIIKVKVVEQTFTWQVTPKGFLSSLRRGNSDLKTRCKSGDTYFDSVVSVRTNDEERFARIFHVDRREEIAKILTGSKGSFILSPGVVSYSEFGLISDDLRRERFMAITELLCDLAEVVDGR